jgi:hypothetical protein
MQVSPPSCKGANSCQWYDKIADIKLIRRIIIAN